MRGRVSFEAGGAQHSLCFTTNALCDLEERSGRSTVAFFGAFDGVVPPMRDVRLAIQCGLGGKVTDAEAGAIIDEIGLQRAFEIINEAALAAFPQPDAANRQTRRAAGKAGAGK